MQLKIWKNCGCKLSSQTFECHWSQSKIFFGLATINGTNILFQAKKICHGCQCLCHTMVLKKVPTWYLDARDLHGFCREFVDLSTLYFSATRLRKISGNFSDNSSCSLREIRYFRAPHSLNTADDQVNSSTASSVKNYSHSGAASERLVFVSGER